MTKAGFPPLIGMDQESWVIAQRHKDRDPVDLLAEFQAMRQHNLAFWWRLSDDDRARAGMHGERGPESTDLIIRLLAGRDLCRLDQIRQSVDRRRPSEYQRSAAHSGPFQPRRCPRRAKSRLI